jgi:uncharacterized protein with PIN domain
MTILMIIIFIVIICWVIYDYKKMDNELRRCPNCNTIIIQKFDLKHNNESIPISGKANQKLNVTVYKCQNCGFSWNHTYEYNESAT